MASITKIEPFPNDYHWNIIANAPQNDGRILKKDKCIEIVLWINLEFSSQDIPGQVRVKPVWTQLASFREDQSVADTLRAQGGCAGKKLTTNRRIECDWNVN